MQPAESRLPLKGKDPHSQHTPANDECGRNMCTADWLSVSRGDGQMERRQPMAAEEDNKRGGEMRERRRSCVEKHADGSRALGAFPWLLWSI